MTAVTAERALEVVRMFAPVVLGIILVVGGISMDFNMALISVGGGMLGVPGIAESVKAVIRMGARDGG